MAFASGARLTLPRSCYRLSSLGLRPRLQLRKAGTVAMVNCCSSSRPKMPQAVC